MWKRDERSKLTEEEERELDNIITDEDVEDDYLDDEVPRHHVSFGTIVLISLTLLLIACFSFLGVLGYKEYNKIFPKDWCSCRVNNEYLHKIDVLGGDSTSYIVSPLGMDLSLIDLSSKLGFNKMQQLSLISSSRRGYQSLKDSDRKLLELSKEEAYKNFTEVNDKTSEEIATFLDSDYTLDKVFFDSDIVNVINLPTELKADVKTFDSEAFITGKYMKSDKAFKIPYKNNIHELIIYKDKLPNEDSWKEVEGTLVVPETSATYTSSSTQTVKSVLGKKQDKVSITQVIHFEILGSGEPENLEYTNKVGETYQVVIRNKNTGLIVVGGEIGNE